MAEFKLGRIKFVYQGAWTTSTAYVVDDVVTVGGKTYICTISHTASALFVTDLSAVPSNWNLVADGSKWTGNWANGTYYNAGDQALYGGVVYLCTTGHTSTSSTATITATGLTLSGGVATLTYSTQAIQPFLVGATITLAGFSPASTTSPTNTVNTTFTVTTCTTTQLTFALTGSYSVSVLGTVAGTSQLGLEADQAKWTAFASNFNWSNAWSTNSRYKVRDLITYGGYTYVCNTAHVSAYTNNDATQSPVGGLEADQAKWDIFNAGIIYRNSWSGSSIRYRINDVVTYGADLWICTTAHTSTGSIIDVAKFAIFVNGFQFENSWDITTQYQVGDMVTYGGYTYTATQNNSAQLPSTATSFWQPFTTGMSFVGDWNSSTAYKIGQVVRLDGYTYTAALDNTVQFVQPTSSIVSSDGTRPNQLTLPSLTITNATATSGTATITYASQPAIPFVAGQTVVIAGVTPAGFNGTYVVVGIPTLTQVQYALAGTLTGSAYGTVSGTTANLITGLPIVFSGTTFGNIVSGTTYFVNTIPDATHFTVSAVQASGTAFALITASGTMTGTTSPKPPFTTYWSQLNSGLKWTPTQNSFTALSGTNVTGTGTGATFNIVAKNTVYLVTVNAGGTGYAATNTIKILGTSVGGASPSNDLVITVNTVSGGVIQSGGVSGSGIGSTWGNGVTYVAGDVIFWGQNSYICILAHVGISGNRPDNDSTGTYWNLLASGAESAVLTTQGDTFYYGGNGPARLPIGTDGQVLRVNNTIPAWQYYGQINNIVYVSPAGTDIIANSQGTTIDKPWATIRYACKQIEDGYLYTSARDLLTINKQFILKEVSNYITYVYQASVTGTSAGAFLTASTAGLSIGMPIRFSAQTGSLTLSSASFNSTTTYYVQAITTNTSFTVALTSGGSAITASGTGTATANYYTSVPSEIERDAGYVIDGVIFDLSHGGTFKTTTNTLAYFNSSGTDFINALVKQQITPFIGSNNYMKTVITSVLAGTAPASNYQALNGISSGNRAIQNTTTGLVAETGSTTTATNLVTILTNALTAGNTSALPSIINPQTTISVKTGTYNEILPIVLPAYTAVVGDELRSTVIQPASADANMVNDKPKSVASLTRLQSVMSNLITNATVSATAGNTQTQVTSLPAGDVGSTAAVTSVKNNCELIYDIVNNGVSNVPTAPAVFAVSTTGQSQATGTVVTLTFATQSAPPYVPNQTIWVYGVTPSGYNSYYTVTSCTTTSVTFNASATGAITVQGTITSLAQQFTLPVVTGYNTASFLQGYGDGLAQTIRNYQYIKDELSAFYNTTYSSVWSALGATGQTAFQNNVGLALDALQFDMSYGGNTQSLVVGSTYYSNYLLTIQATEKAPTIGVYTRLKTVIGQIVQAQSVTPTAGNVTSQTTVGTAGTSGAATFAQARIQDIIDWINNGSAPSASYPTAAIALTSATTQASYNAVVAKRSEIQSDTVAWVVKFYHNLNFNSVLCSRDSGLIADALAYDLAFGSNLSSITIGRSYNRAISSVTVVRTSQLAAELGSINFIKYKVKHIAGAGAVAQISNAMDDIISYINGGSVPARFTWPEPTNIVANTGNAARLIHRNKAFIQAEVAQYLSANYSSVWTSVVQATYTRDFGYIIDALRYDLTYGSNIATSKTGKAYYSYITGAANFQPSEKTAILAYIAQINTIAQALAQGGNYTPLQTAVPRIAGAAGTSTQSTLVNGLLTTLTNIVTSGYAGVNSITISAIATGTTFTSGTHGLNVNDIVVVPGTGSASTISGVVLTVGGTVTGAFAVGQIITGTGVTPGTYISSLGSGTGGAGTYNVNQIQTVSSTAITGTGVSYFVASTPLVTTFTLAASYGGTALTTFTNGTGLSLVAETQANGSASWVSATLTGAQTTLSAAKTAIVGNVISFINTTYPNFTYNQAICFRDLGFVIDAVGYDLMFGGNFQTAKAAMSYYQAQAKIVTGAQKSQTLASFNYLAQQIATTLVNVSSAATTATTLTTLFVNILTNGIGDTPEVHGSIVYNNTLSTINGVEIVRRNINFLAYEGSAYTTASYGGTTLNTAVTTASATAGTIAGYTFTAGGSVTGTFTVGMVLSGSGVTTGTYITAAQSSTVFTVSSYQTVSSTTVSGTGNVLTTTSSHNLSVGDPVYFPSATAISTTVSAVATSGNRVTVASSTGMTVGMSLNIVGTAIGALSAGTYYVASIIDGTGITVKATYTGSVFTIGANASGTMTVVSTNADGSFGNLSLNIQYFVLAVPSTTTLILTQTSGSTTPYTMTSAAGTMKLSYYFTAAKYIRDTTEFLNALIYDLQYTGSYKSLRAAKLYNNAVGGSISENMFLVRNGTGIRNTTMTGLTGYLTNANIYGTKRPTAGSYASLDPGFGPNDSNVWIYSRSCYVQNNTMFGYACNGAKVDGALHAGGNRSIVANDYTTIIGDGIGFWVTGSNAVAELVSVFNYYGYAGYLAELGAKIRATNGNSSYGTYGVVAEGVDTYETPVLATLNNRYFQAFINNVVTDATNNILRFEYANAGQNYTNTVHSISGSGYNATAIADEFRDASLFETRLIDLNDGKGVGGSSYVTQTNVAQGGDRYSINIAATDTALTNAYNGMRLQIVAGTGVGQYTNILNYTYGSKLALIYKDSFTNLTVTGTTTTVLQVASTGTLYLNMPIYLGATTGVALTANTLYFVKTIPDATTFTVSLTSGGAAITGLTATSSQSISLYAAGWDHVIPGYTIQTALDLTSGYVIEPRISFTAPGYTATARTLNNTSTWSSVAYGANYYVAISTGATTANYSVNGKTWAAAGALPSATTWNSLVYAGGQGATATAIIGGLGGTGAVLQAVLGTGLLATQVVAINIINGGFNYNTIPTIVVVGGGGVGATATATVLNGAITSITMAINGSGYSSLPTVNAVTSSMTSVTVNSWGKNYFSTPNVVVSQPAGLNPTGWAATTAVSLSAYLQTAAGRIYQVTSAGTTGSTAPTTDYKNSVTTGIVDGTATLTYIATQTQLTPVLTNAGVSTYTIGVAGYGYTATPTITVLDTSARFVAISATTATAINSIAGIASTWASGGNLPAANFASLAYGNGVLVAVGGSAGTGLAASSSDSPSGTTWISRTPTALGGGSYSAVAYGNSTFLAVQTGGQITTSSTNGVSWAAGGLLPTSTTWTALAYGNGRFVALAVTGAVAYTIDKGVTWTAAPSASGATTSVLSSSFTWSAITYSQGLFLAIAKGTTVCATSPDGVNWTVRAMPSSSNWQAVTAGNISGTNVGAQPLFVAVSNTSGTAAASIIAGAQALGRMKVASNAITEVRMIEPGSSYPKGNVTATTVTTNLITADDTSNLIDSQPIEFVNLDSAGLTTNVTYYVIGATITSTQFKVSLVSGSATAVTLSTTTSSTATYRAGPIATQFDPNKVNTAPFRVRMGDGVLGNPSFGNRGTNNSTATASTAGDGYAEIFQNTAYVNVSGLYSLPSAGANVQFASITGNAQWYKLVAITNVLGVPGSYTAQFQVNPAVSTLLAPPHGTLITTRLKYSQVRLTGHDFLYIGTGNQTQTNYPYVVPANAIQANQQNASGGGRCFFTSTDQDGNFNVGNLFGVQQSTGTATLNASAFNLSGLQSLQLGAVSIGVGSAIITQFSTDPYFTANSDNIVPTQKAIKSYITAQIGGGSSSLNVNTLTAGQILIANNSISNTTGSGAILVTSKMNFTGGIDGAPVALVFFGQR
jgi:hypothetical protein